jgi:beta-mannosidase
VSWSSVDYYGRWKALHYFVKKLYQDILISQIIKNNKVEVWINSDKETITKGKLKLELMNFNGKVLWSKTTDCAVNGNSSGVVFHIDSALLLSNYDATKVFLHTSFTNNAIEIASHNLYFTQIAKLDLPKPQLTKTMKYLTNGNAEILVSTDKLAKNLCLTSTIEGHFSDNYFDLLPNETKKISIKCSKEEYTELQKSLQIISLTDSY